jgi:hypothetical protein
MRMMAASATVTRRRVSPNETFVATDLLAQIAAVVVVGVGVGQ